jgi:hypothetical protein
MVPVERTRMVLKKQGRRNQKSNVIIMVAQYHKKMQEGNLKAYRARYGRKGHFNRIYDENDEDNDDDEYPEFDGGRRRRKTTKRRKSTKRRKTMKRRKKTTKKRKN